MKDKKVIKRGTGSALILAVVLVSLLAVVGVMFAMVARIDKMSTSAIAENKTLNLAVDTVIAKISQELASDTPVLGEEYYDYPDANNAWLASLEPYEYTAGNYRWRQISDIYYRFGPQDIWNLRAEIIDDYQAPAEIGDSNIFAPYRADADGDGVSDSVWIKLDNITSSKGRPIYAAVRIIDNGGMLNVNTGYKFDSADPNTVAADIDGSRLAQIHLLDFTKGVTDDANDLHRFRCDGSEPDLLTFNYECAIRVENPDRTNINYLPYDIGDELELRNRYVLDAQYHTARVEAALPISLTYPAGATFRNRSTPVDDTIGLTSWKKILSPIDPCDPNIPTDSYNFRHLLTTCNMDRIINPLGGKMVNINGPPADVNELYYTLLASIDPNIASGDRTLIKGRFAQLAVNIVDFIDGDIAVTVLEPNDPNIRPAYYGFDAQPFITEIGFIIDADPQAGRNYYAIELCNPFNQEIRLEDFELELRSIDGNAPSIPSILFDACDVIPAAGCFVIANVNDPPFDMDTNDFFKVGPQLAFFGGWQPPPSIKPPPPTGPPTITPPSGSESGWKYNYILYLTRKVGDPNDPNWIYVDRQRIDPAGAGEAGYFGRDVRDWHIVYDTQTLFVDSISASGTLGGFNNIYLGESEGHRFSFFLPNPLVTPQEFITVGDIPRILTIGHGDGLNNTIGEKLTLAAGEGEIRLDLQSPYYSNIFQYLTVFDPSTDGIDNDGDNGPDENDRSEWKIPGRININTAPWYVIAQLPWVSAHTPNYGLARTIIAYRDKTLGPSGYDYSARFGQPGFRSIGELNYVVDSNLYCSIDYYAQDDADDSNFPDLTPADGIIDDFEERDVIFSRISNLITVRSDVFTVYILVRIGSDGPQKRSVAILDRSDVYPIPSGGYTGRVKARALHPVADPR